MAPARAPDRDARPAALSASVGAGCTVDCLPARRRLKGARASRRRNESDGGNAGVENGRGRQLNGETWETLREQFVRNSFRLPSELPEEIHEAERQSQTTWVFETLLARAAELGQQAEIKPGSEESLHLLERAYETASDLTFGFWFHRLPVFNEARLAEMSREEVANALRILPEDGRYFVQRIKELRLYDVARDDIETGVESYLESEFRVPQIDRMILVALTDMEIAAYLKEVAGSKLFNLPDYGAMLERNIAWQAWFIGLLGIGTIAGLAVGGMFAFDMFVNPLPEAVRLGVIYATGFLAVPLFALMTWFAFFDHRGKKLTDEQEKIINQMVTFASEVHGPGPLSLPHFRKLLDDGRRDGIVWPKATWALLDDIERRGITRI